MSKFELIAAISCGEPDKGGVDLFDLRSGAHIRGWNTGIASPAAYTILDDAHMVLSANTDKSTTAGIQIWNWRNGSNRSAAKCLLSEKITCWSHGPDSIWLAGGSPSGTIYIWEIATGVMVRRIEAGHYKGVSAMATTTDGAYLITGGDDRMVNIWLWSDLVSLPSVSSLTTGIADAQPSAVCTLSDHAGKITSIFVGAGGINGRIVTSSDDRTCKLWDLPSKSLLRSFVFPSAIVSCAMDASQSYLVAAASDPPVAYKQPLVPTISAGSMSAASVSTTMTTSLPRGSVASSSSSSSSSVMGVPVELKGHEKALTSIAVSYDGSLIVTSSDDATIRVWDAVSGQLLRTIKRSQRSSYDCCMIVTDIAGFLSMEPPALELAAKRMPSFPPLQRTIRDTATAVSATATGGTVLLKRRAVTGHIVQQHIDYDIDSDDDQQFGSAHQLTSTKNSRYTLAQIEADWATFFDGNGELINQNELKRSSQRDTGSRRGSGSSGSARSDFIATTSNGSTAGGMGMSSGTAEELAALRLSVEKWKQLANGLMVVATTSVLGDPIKK